MRNKSLIKKIDNKLGEKTKLKENKSVRLLRKITKELIKSDLSNNTNLKELADKLDIICQREPEDIVEIKKGLKDLNTLMSKLSKDVFIIKDDKKVNNQIDEMLSLLSELTQKKYPTKIEIKNPVNEVIVKNLEEGKIKSITVDNFPKQQKFPKSFKVNNFPKQKEFPKEIKVSNPVTEVTIKKPSWFKQFELSGLITGINNIVKPLVDKVLANTFKINADKYKQKDNAIAVKLVNKKGEFLDTLIPPITVTNPGGSGGGNSITQVLDKNKSIINPATAEKQDSAIAVLNDLATEDKQDDIITELETIESNQRDGDQKTQIVDSSGNVIDSSQDADGEYHLSTALIQKIITSTNNSTETNLTAGNTFTGTADETFGVSGIQVFHASDQDCTIYIDQSIDDSFPASSTITDSFECLADSPCSRTFVSVSPYYRLRVTNNGASATTSLSTFTGMTPMINPLPRALSEDGRLEGESTLVGRENTNRHVWVTPTNALSIESPVRLVGTNFDGQTKDTNFWSETGTANGGTVTQDGEIELKTSTATDGAAMYTSVRKARFVASSALKFQGLFKFVTAETADNLRRMGAYLATDGFFFQLDGSTFSIGHRKNSTDTLVNSGSFNGNYGPTWKPLTTRYYKFEIEWTPKGAFWYVDGKLLHKVTTGHISEILTLPIKFENVNDGSTTDVVFDCLAVVIVRLGDLHTNPTYYYHALGTTTGVQLKIGAGVLHRILINNVVNNSVITISDGLTGVTNPIMVHTAGDSKASVSPIEIGAPFSDGLRLTVSTQNASLTLIYE